MEIKDGKKEARKIIFITLVAIVFRLMMFVFVIQLIIHNIPNEIKVNDNIINTYDFSKREMTENESSNPIFAKLYKDGTLILSSQNYSDPKRKLEHNYGDVSSITYENYQDIRKIGWLDVKDKLTWNQYTLIGSRTEKTNKAKRIIIKDEIHPTNVNGWFYDLDLSNDVENLSNLKLDKIDDLKNLFEYCKLSNFNFSQLDIRDNNISSLNNKLFYDKTIENLSFNGVDFSKITDMSHMFDWATIENLDLSNFDTSNVTNMSHMFDWARIEKLDLSNFDTSKVTNMSYMFVCARIKNLDLSNFDTSNVINMSYMFYNARIEKLDLSGLDISNVNTTSGMFIDAQIKELKVKKTDSDKINKLLKEAEVENLYFID